MTVVWKLDADELKSAVRLFMKEKYGVDVEGLDVRVVQWANNCFTASVEGSVDEGLSLGPYR